MKFASAAEMALKIAIKTPFLSHATAIINDGWPLVG